jgi:putative transposase
MPGVRSVSEASDPCHILQYGAGSRRLFREDRDRYVYLQLLREAGARHGIRFDGYCLMDDHVHLVAGAEDEISLLAGLRRARRLYAGYLKDSTGGSGRVWRGQHWCRLTSAPVRWQALAYIEMNPVRTGLCTAPEDYWWSSARAHLETGRPFLPLQQDRWQLEWDAATWGAALRRMGRDYFFWRRLRTATSGGIPLGAGRSGSPIEWLAPAEARFIGRAAKAAAAGQSAPALAQGRLDFGV